MPDKPWEKRCAYARKVAERDPRTKILIVCEGAKTEPNYFRGFPVDKEVVDVQIEGEGLNTDVLVERAMEMSRRAVALKRPYNQVWCVFDRDSFPGDSFNRALQLARGNRIRVAYSNEAFELWYLLHFVFHDTGVTRGKYCEMLTVRLGREYQKNDPTMYETLLSMQGVATRNAGTLLSRYKPCNPAKDNPSTTVHELVEELGRFVPE
jgi:hypothetical protein